MPLSIQGYKETIPCAVIDLADDYDIILGDAWLYDHAGIIDYQHGHLRLVSRGREVTLRIPSTLVASVQPHSGHGRSSSPPCLCSLWVALCAFCQSSPVHLVLVCRVGDLPEGDAPGPSSLSS